MYIAYTIHVLQYVPTYNHWCSLFVHIHLYMYMYIALYIHVPCVILPELVFRKE